MSTHRFLLVDHPDGRQTIAVCTAAEIGQLFPAEAVARLALGRAVIHDGKPLLPRAIRTTGTPAATNPKGPRMKTIILTTAAMIGALVLPGLAFAVTKSSASAMSFPEYVAAQGCVLVDKGGYSNVEAPGGGFCDGMQGHLVAGSELLTIDPDGVPGTGDEYDRRIGDR